MELFNDLIHNIKFSQVLDPAVINSDTDGSQIDVQGFRQNVFYFVVGNSADTLNGTNTITLRLYESDTSGAAHTDPGYAEVDDADVIVDPDKDSGAYPVVIDGASEDSRGFAIEYKGAKRYLIAVVDFDGTHATGTPIGIVALQGSPSDAPVTQGT